jgi:ubiquinone/menaquinone biosynthesis C-methylase UbiE
LSEGVAGPGKATAAAERLAREIEFHRSIAERAERVWNWDTPAGRSRAQRRAQLFIEHALLAPGRLALEVGCGTGLFLAQVAQSGATVRALDLSTHLLAKARAQLDGRANVALQCGNAEQMPYPDGTFDAVYGSSVLHHLDIDRALREVFRVLRPGGRMVFTEPNILNPQVTVMFKVNATKRYFGVSPDEMAFSRFRALRALREAGFRDGRARPFDFLHPSTPTSLVGALSRAGELAERMPLLREIAGSLLIRAVKP